MTDQLHVHAAPSTPLNTEVRFVAVERDVAGLKADIGEIKTSMNVGFEKLGTAIAGKGTNWTVVGLVLGAVFTVSGWGFALFGNFQSRTNDDILGLKTLISANIAEQKATVSDMQADNKATIAAMQADTKASLATLAASQKAGDDALATEFKATNDKFISRTDLLDKFQTSKEKRDSQQAMTDARLDRLDRDLNDVKKDVVPRGEHAEIWKHQLSTDQNLQRQIDENRKAVVDLNTPRDTMQGILRRLDRVEMKEAGK